MNVTRHIVAFLVMLGGAGTTFAALVAMNASEFTRDEVKPREAITFERKVQKKKKKTSKPKPAPQKRLKANNAPPPPMPELGIEMGGIDLGLGVGIGDVALGQDALQAQPRATVMTEDAVDSKPKARQRTAAVYPKRARAKGVEGFVRFTLLIDESGRVARTKVLEAQPPGVFDEEAKRAVTSWTFQPAMYQGAPVKVWATQTIRFQLR